MSRLRAYAFEVRSGRGWAYLGVLIGGAVSIAANVAHSYVPPAGASGVWQPQLGAVVGAVFWPVFLFVALEILARIDWPSGWRWRLLRFGGLVPVALVAAVVSYRHLSGLLVFYGEDRLTAAIGPLAVDGLMIVATGGLLATSRHRESSQKDVHSGQSIVDSGAGESVSVPVRPARVDAPTSQLPPVPAHLLTAAAATALEHRAVTGEDITRDGLRAALGVSHATAGELAHALRVGPATASPNNVRPS